MTIPDLATNIATSRPAVHLHTELLSRAIILPYMACITSAAHAHTQERRVPSGEPTSFR